MSIWRLLKLLLKNKPVYRHCMTSDVFIDQMTFLYLASALLQVFGAILFGGSVFWVVRNQRESVRLDERRKLLATEIARAEWWLDFVGKSSMERSMLQVTFQDEQLRDRITKRLASSDTAAMIGAANTFVRQLNDLQPKLKADDVKRNFQHSANIVMAASACWASSKGMLSMRRWLIAEILALAGVMLYLGVLICMARGGHEHACLAVQSGVVSIVGLVVTVAFAWAMTVPADVSDPEKKTKLPEKLENLRLPDKEGDSLLCQ